MLAAFSPAAWARDKNLVTKIQEKIFEGLTTNAVNRILVNKYNFFVLEALCLRRLHFSSCFAARWNGLIALGQRN